MDALDASILSFELQPLDTLRIELQNEPAFMESSMPKDDHTLTRFLKARGYNASQAKQMILDCVHWRRTVEDVGIEELYRSIDPYNFPGREEVFESWPMGFHKTDRFGRPVNIQSFGAISAKRLYRHITPEEHWRNVLVNVESLLAEVFPAASVAAGRPIRQALVIVDLKGFGLAQFWALKSIARRSFEISQSYFPETMGQMIVINAPTSFTAIWTIVKPWLSPRTLEKISVLGANQHHAVLHDLVSPENLPTTLGGTCTCDGLPRRLRALQCRPMDGRRTRRAPSALASRGDCRAWRAVAARAEAAEVAGTRRRRRGRREAGGGDGCGGGCGCGGGGGGGGGGGVVCRFCHHHSNYLVGPRIRSGAPPPPSTHGCAGSRAPRGLEKTSSDVLSRLCLFIRSCYLHWGGFRG
ncbi:CRAL-TRIO domain-containing protein [Lactarius psammicola]|nr:CRAL-TRIO domain-containing protein [Lactarius psammicola]